VSKGRLILVLVLVCAFSLLLVRMAIHSQAHASIWDSPLVIAAILGFGIAPVYPLYRSLKKRPPGSAVPVLLLIAALISGIVWFIGNRIIHIDATWVSVTWVLFRCLFVASCLGFIWNGFVQRHRSSRSSS
jgi:hypothetical protein